MELTLSDAEFYWGTKQQKDESGLPTPELTRVAVLLPATEGGDTNDQELSLPCTIRVTTSEAGEQEEGSNTAGERPIVFKVLEGKQLVASHAMRLQDCVPVLSEGTISWTHDVVVNHVRCRLNCFVGGTHCWEVVKLTVGGLYRWRPRLKSSSMSRRTAGHAN